MTAEHAFACTMLVARRIYPDALSHRLSSLADMLRLPKSGRAHRAMVDAEMASHLWCRLQQDIARTYGLDRIDHALMTRVQATAKAKVPMYLRSLAGAHA